ncbi:ATP-grasp domain-containing protein [Pseudaestuariivita rosea]|uniref:ATP-grasp domain-containing protein n=1 Tax=Pseudaestuariivita rosea TaxID=2763263 RepID=UPI001ABA2B59|nr:ATP-grasp domain-containing protein [Pseudaestuariivita rosea]
MSQITWVLQEKSIKPDDFQGLRQAVLAHDHRLEIMNVVPFAHEPDGPIPHLNGPVVVYGSEGLLNVARHQGWAPAGWDGDCLNQSAVLGHHGTHALNTGAAVVPHTDIADHMRNHGMHRAFLRPDSEGKAFPGQVMTLDEVESWLTRLHDADYFAESVYPVVVAPVQKIGREWRSVIVDGQIAAISQYANHGENDRQPGAPADVVQALQAAVTHYAPLPVFVADIAECLQDNRISYKIIEYNSFNSAGLYACDKMTVVAAVSGHVAAQFV